MSSSHPCRSHLPELDRAALQRAGRLGCKNYRVLLREPADDTPLLSGHYRVWRLRNGLQAKCADVFDLRDMTIEAEVAPSLHLLVLLAGQARGRYGKQGISLGQPDRPSAEAALINLAEPERFVRQSRSGAYERKIGLTVEPAWLEESGLLQGALGRFQRSHLAMRHWQPSPRAQAIAGQMLAEPSAPPALQALYLESRALELLSEAFSQLEHGALPTPRAQPERNLARIRQLCEWLDSGAADDLSLSEIARHAGINAHSLQQQFRAACGLSIFEYQRRRRLMRARQALERGELSISQAAWAAGYGSAANFATAFRRCFGLSPREVAES